MDPLTPPGGSDPFEDDPREDLRADVTTPSVTPVDLDADGDVDVVSIERTDGSSIAMIDADETPGFDVVMRDDDGDGLFETVELDSDADGAPDIVQSDADRDGMYEETLLINEDIMLSVDPLTGLVVEVERGAPDADAVAERPPDRPFRPGLTPPVAAPEPEADGIAGDPTAEIAWGQVQSENGFCVPVSVGMIVSEFTGVEHTESEMVQTAIDLELLYGEPGAWVGMTTQGTEDLLEHFGIDATIEYGSLAELEGHLDQNAGIVVMIDADELWEGASDDARGDDAGADHAAVLTGIDYDRGVVILNDPGQLEGVGWELPISEFMDAWDDSNYEMVVTEDMPRPAAAESPRGGLSTIRHPYTAFVLLPVVIGAGLLRRATQPEQ